MLYDKKDKIFLVGFMGSGKSTLGRKIATALNYEFSDLDNYIESRYGQPIHEIFQKHGEEYFRNLETECLAHYNKKYTVIATGGGTPCFNNNMELMMEYGCCIYIKMPEGALFQRLVKASKKRPLLMGKSDEELKIFISETLLDREKYYSQSHIIIDGLKVSTSSLIGILKNKVELKM